MFGLLFSVWLPRRFFSNLRTACSETLMLRERKASIADRSLSSLTGELLLLATAAAAFATFAARRLGGDVRGQGEWAPCWWLGGGGSERVGHRKRGGGLGVWRESLWCMEVYQEVAGIITRVTWGGDQRPHATQRGGRVHRVRPQRSKGRGHRGREGPGAMQEGSRMTRPPPKTTTTTQHQITGGRRGVKWRIERNKKQGEN